jgi:hypothetical protein
MSLDKARATLARMMYVSATKDLPRRKELATEALEQLQKLAPHVTPRLEAMNATDLPHMQDNLLWNAFVILCDDKTEVMFKHLKEELQGDYLIPHLKIWLTKK